MMPVADEQQRLVFVRAALDNLRGPMGLAAAQALLGDRDLSIAEARVRLEAERVVLEEAVAKGRGGKPIGDTAAPAGMHEEPGAPNQQFEQLHPRGGHGMFIKKGESSPRVKAMQQRLNELGHPAVPDGNFGSQTEQQVKALQKKYGLPQTGHVDATTLEFMRNPPSLSYQQANSELRAAAAAAGQAVGPGSVGPAVQSLQQQLVQLGFDTGMDEGSHYGRGTEAAVRLIQKQNGYAPTGRADEQTLALIARLVQEQTAQQGANRLTGDSASTWGLRPGARPGVPTGRSGRGGRGASGNGRATPRPNARPNRNVKVQHADTTEEGIAVEESTAATVAAAGLAGRFATILEGPPKPPGLRESDGGQFAACASCVFFGGPATSSLGGCQKYGGYPVDRDDLCDEWKTATPEEARHPRGPWSRTDDVIDADEMREGEEQELSEVKSDAYPGLDRSPKENWVDKAGGLPRYIERIAKHVHYEHGKSIGTAIAIAVGTVRRWCHGGEVAASAKGGVSKTHGVSPKTKAQACAAVAEWEAKKKASSAKSAAEAAAIMEAAGFVYDPVALADFDAVLQEHRADFKPFPPSLNYARRILAEVEAQYDDWDAWGDDGSAPEVSPALADSLLVFAQEAVAGLAPEVGDPTLPPFGREGMLHVAGVPVARFGSPSELVVAEEAARALDLRLRRMNPKQLRHRAARALRHLKGGLHEVDAAHPQADLDVAAVVSSRFAGRLAKPLTLKYNQSLGEGAASPERGAAEGEDLLTEGLGGLASKPWDELKHPRVKGRKGGGEFAKKVGHMDAETHAFVERTIGLGDGGAVAKKTAHHQDAEALTVDQAIGGVLANFPGLKDWSVDKHEQGGWLVRVEMKDGEHHFHVSDDGKVSQVNADGSPKEQAPTHPQMPPTGGEVAGHAVAGGAGFEETGDWEKPYHMANGTHFKTAKGAILKKHESGKFTSAKGNSLAGVHVEDVKTGEKKWVPAFVLKEPHAIVAPGGGAKKPEPKPDNSSALDASVAQHHGLTSNGADLTSFEGKNVVVTGKIEGYTREDVHALIAKKGGKVQSSVGPTTDVLVTGGKVGKTKTAAAEKHGTQVVDFEDVRHLLEAELSRTVRRIMGVHAELAESASGDMDARLRARLRVLETRLDADERTAYIAIRPERAALVLPRKELARA